jgi:hypothetical protein
MATSIDQAFIRNYERQVHLVFQRTGSYLKDTVRFRPDVVGSSTTFQKIATGVATTKARHGTITPMNQTHTAHEATLADFYAGDWVDKLDEAKINIDERDALATSGAFALGRKVDSQIDTLLAAENTNNVTITVTSSGAVRAGLLQMAANLYEGDIPNDGQVFGALSAVMWARAMAITDFSSSDFIGSTGLPFTEGVPTGGRFKDWMGVKWVMHSGLTGVGTATANSYVWHRMSIGYGAGKHAGNVAGRGSVGADITWHGDRAAHFVNHMMSGGGVTIDGTGIIEGQSDDTAAIAAT